VQQLQGGIRRDGASVHTVRERLESNSNAADASAAGLQFSELLTKANGFGEVFLPAGRRERSSCKAEFGEMARAYTRYVSVSSRIPTPQMQAQQACRQKKGPTSIWSGRKISQNLRRRRGF
jgi:hypothetical protein